MAQFKPERFGFVRIDYSPSAVAFYEYRCHDAVNGRADYMRLNIYLSRDGDFTCISNGLIEPKMTELMFELPAAKQALNFNECYCEQLFRGYIETDGEAEVILRALRLDKLAKSLPQVLRGAPHDLRCEMIDGH